MKDDDDLEFINTYTKFSDQNISNTSKDSDEIERIPFISEIILEDEKEFLDKLIDLVTHF